MLEKNFIIPGIIELASKPPSTSGKVIVSLKITIGVTAIMTFIMTFIFSMSTSLQCFFSFVRDPILYKNDDMLDDKGQVVSDRWKAANAPPYSENITSMC